LRSTSAMPDMPMPPMPTKWMGPIWFGSFMRAVSRASRRPSPTHERGGIGQIAPFWKSGGQAGLGRGICGFGTANQPFAS
jgi:hypothetical protein